MKSGIVLIAVAASCLSLGYWMGRYKEGSFDEAPEKVFDGSEAVTLLPETGLPLNREELIELFSQSGTSGKLELYQLLEGISGVKAQFLINEILAKPLFEKEKELLSELYVKWFDLDRDAAFEDAMGRTGAGAFDAKKAVFVRWAEVSPDEAWSRFDQTKNLKISARWTIGNAVLEEIARKDPEKALKFSLNPTAGRASYSPSSVLNVWAQSDPAAAAAAIQDIGSPWSRAREYRNVAGIWAKVDLEAAWEWATALGNSDEKREAQEAVMDSAIHTDWRSAVQLYEELPPRRRNTRVLNNLLSKMSVDAPAEAYEFATEHSKGAGSVAVFDSLWWNWAQQDPEGALEVAKRDQSGGDENWSNTFRIIIDSVSRTDSERATKMMQSLTDPKAYESAAYAIANNLMSRDMDQAMEWAMDLPSGKAKEKVLASTLGTWGLNSPAGALEFANQLPESKERDASLKSIAKSWATKDPVAALEWADSHLDNPESRKSTLPYMIGQLANTDVKKAAEWVSSQKEGEVRSASSSYLISEWVQMDFVAAGKWLNQLEKGNSRDSAVDTYARHIFKQDTEAARGWIESISGEEKRHKLIREMAISLSRTNPESAGKWLSATSLGPEEKAAVLEKMNR